MAYALVPAAKRRKFADRTVKMRFLGYHKGHHGYKLMERGGNRLFYRTDVTFDEHNFRLSPEEAERDIETPTVEVDVCSSGRRANQPALDSTDVPAEEPAGVPARLRVTPEMVAVPNVPQPEPAAVHSRPTRIKKPIERYGVDEQLNIARLRVASRVLHRWPLSFTQCTIAIKKSVEIINPQSLSHSGTNRKLSFSAPRSWAHNLLRFTMDPPNG